MGEEEKQAAAARGEPIVVDAATAEPAEHPLAPPRRSGSFRGWLFLLAVAAGVGGFYFWLSAKSQPPDTVAVVEPAPEMPSAPATASFHDCDDCPEMSRVPAGTFLMGSPASDPQATPAEQPQHPVTITAPFAVGRTEVTFAQWLACVADGGCRGYRPPHEGWGGGSRPVINVNWNDANAYISWLAHKTGKPYRLPTEAEWEYATRAGTTTRYWWGDEIGHDRANCKTCGSQWDEQQTAPTASFAANAFGLFDVAGNVWEWVEDCWQDDYTRTSPEGVPPSTRRGCSKRTLRGGSWDNSPEQLRSAARIWGRPDGRDNSIGFRVALSLPANAE